MDIMRYGGSAWRNVKLAPVAKDVHFDNESGNCLTKVPHFVGTKLTRILQLLLF